MAQAVVTSSSLFISSKEIPGTPHLLKYLLALVGDTEVMPLM
jgi:hypothetical protein